MSNNPELDPNKIIAELTARGISEISDAVFGPAAKKIRRAYQTITNAYKPYMEQTYRKVSKVKTFLKVDEPVNLLDIFVPLKFKKSDKITEQHTVLEHLQSGGKIIISALAGRGKSVFMRYIATTLYHNGRGQIPLFLDLRSLNTLTKKEILPYIHSTYNNEKNISFSDFIEAIKSNLFVIILDGFDEVDYDSRKDVESQILEFSFAFPNLPLIVSGRPDDRFDSWEQFHHYQICPMDLGQVKEMINKCEYDDEVRKAFLKKLSKEFFEEHESFLSTPLLAVLLMLTFELNAEIPKTLHTFYENAFATLVRRHDAQKALFQRKTYTGCSVEEFSKIFAAFCFLTYSRSEFQFSEQEITEAISISIKKSGINVEADAVLKDFIESICLLQKEGLEYSFVHRSFQEYFSALFLSRSPFEIVDKFLNKQFVRAHDSVLSMLFQMDRDRLEKDWVSQKVPDFLEIFLKNNGNHQFLLMAFERIDYIFIKSNVAFYSFIFSDYGFNLVVLKQFYPQHFERFELFNYYLQHLDDNSSRRITNVLDDLANRKDTRLSNLSEIKKDSEDVKSSSGLSVLKMKFDEKDYNLMDDLELSNVVEDLPAALSAVQREVFERANANASFINEIFS